MRTSVKYLLSQHASTEITDHIKNTPLILAASNGHLKVVRLLVESGANIHAENHLHGTAMTVADAKGYADIVAFLEDAERNYESRLPFLDRLKYKFMRYLRSIGIRHDEL